MLCQFNAGVSLAGEDGQRARSHLSLGLGLDWLSEHGLAGILRTETSETLDVGVGLSAGYFFAGLRANRGLPFGLAAGPLLFRESDGRYSAGGRGTLLFSLWYNRATIATELAWLRRFEGSHSLAMGQIILRLAPWSPWYL